MPLAYHELSVRPHGSSALAKADGERKILEVMSAYVTTVSKSRPPPPLVKTLAGASVSIWL